MRWALVAMLLAACRFDFHETDRGDADVNGQLGPWGAPSLVGELYVSTAQRDDPTLTQDMLEIYFDDDRDIAGGGQGDIWLATRSSIADPFGPAAPVQELVSPSDDTTPDLTPDGLTLYFAADRQAAGDRDIYFSTRLDRQTPWSTPKRIAAVSSTSDDGAVCESADGLTMIFGTARSSGGDLYQTTRPDRASPWGAPTKIPNLSGPAEESQQWCNDNLTLVYFTSNAGSASRDIWVTSRASPADTFATPTRVDEVSTATVDETDPWVSPDLRTMFFFRNSPGQGGIYTSTR